MNATSLAAQPLTPEKVDRAYDSPPWWYDVRGFFILCFSYRSTLWSQISFFSKNFSSGRHLEAAIGTGTLFVLIRWWRLLRRLPQPHTVGFDYAEAMLRGAQRRLGAATDVTLVRADVAALDFPAASFDSANIANAVHCFPDVEGGLRELARVLKPGATLALNALLEPTGPAPLRWISLRINAWGMRKGILHSALDAEELQSMLERAGFGVEQSFRIGNALNVLARRRLV